MKFLVIAAFYSVKKYYIINNSKIQRPNIWHFRRHWVSILVTSLFLTGLSTNGTAQYLDTIYDIGHDARPSFTLLEGGDILIANANNNQTNLYQYARLNSQGLLLDSLNLHYPANDYFFANCKRALVCIGKNLYNAYTNFHQQDSTYIILSKLSLNPLDTLQTHLYFADRSIYIASQALVMVYDSDSSFLLSGLHARWALEPDSVLKYDLFLSRIDTNFQVVWETIVPDGQYGRDYGPMGTDILIDEYGGILVTGNEFFYPLLEIGFAARFNQAGQNLWYKEYPGTLGMSGMYCVDNGDGSYQYIQNQWTRAQGDANDLITGRMDTLGNILSSKRIGKINRMQFAQDLIQTSDSNFYVSGIGYYINMHSYGFKFSPQGDSLWYRSYHHDDSLDLAYLETFREDSAGNLVHFGYHVNNINPGPNNNLSSWLYRTDADGCIFKDCQLGKEELGSLPPFILYPNPSRGTFNFDLPLNEHRPAYLEIYNSSGGLAETHRLPDSPLPRYRISSSLATGQYYVVLRSISGKKIGLASLSLIK